MIKLLKSSTVHFDYLARFYAARPGLEQRPYAVQHRELMADCFGWSDFWKTHLEATGEFAVEEVIYNCAPLQKTWAREAGVSYSESDWLIEILRAQLQALEPEIWFLHGYELGPATRLRFRREMPWIRWVVGWDGIVKNDPLFYAGADQVLVCHPGSAAFYTAAGVRAHYFRLGFEDSILGKLTARRPLNDVAFVGGIWLQERGHNKRVATLDKVAREIPVGYWLSGSVGVDRSLRAAIAEAARGHLRYALDCLAAVPAAGRLGRLSRGPLFGLAMYQTLADSKIVLNVHIDAAGDKAANMRLFEATGSGACLLTDHKANLGDLFAPDKEIVTFRSPEECVAKIRYLLDHEKERSMIARSGQARTLRDHTLAKSISGFVRALEDAYPR